MRKFRSWLILGSLVLATLAAGARVASAATSPTWDSSYTGGIGAPPGSISYATSTLTGTPVGGNYLTVCGMKSTPGTGTIAMKIDGVPMTEVANTLSLGAPNVMRLFSGFNLATSTSFIELTNTSAEPMFFVCSSFNDAASSISNYDIDTVTGTTFTSYLNQLNADSLIGAWTGRVGSSMFPDGSTGNWNTLGSGQGLWHPSPMPYATGLNTVGTWTTSGSTVMTAIAFEIEPVGVTPPPIELGGATSTVDQIQDNLFYAYVLFLLTMVIMIWIMRKH